jgi:hypothetical protein
MLMWLTGGPRRAQAVCCRLDGVQRRGRRSGSARAGGRRGAAARPEGCGRRRRQGACLTRAARGLDVVRRVNAGTASIPFANYKARADAGAEGPRSPAPATLLAARVQLWPAPLDDCPTRRCAAVRSAPAPSLSSHWTAQASLSLFPLSPCFLSTSAHCTRRNHASTAPHSTRAASLSPHPSIRPSPSSSLRSPVFLLFQPNDPATS